jgi:hypothetical protein
MCWPMGAATGGMIAGRSRATLGGTADLGQVDALAAASRIHPETFSDKFLLRQRHQQAYGSQPPSSQKSRLRRLWKMLKEIRGLTILLVVSGVLGAASAALAQTAAGSYPFCLQGADFTGWSGCTFATFEQCMGAATGMPAMCVANPYYTPPANVATSPSEGNPPLPTPAGPRSKR